MHLRSIFYKALNVVCKADITRVLLLNAKQFANKPVHSGIACHFLNVEELETLVDDVDFRISREFINDFEALGFIGVAARFEGRLVGMLFLVSKHVAARHNSGGAAFNGIGLDVPANVYYLFKVIVKPTDRGKRINAAMIAFAVEKLASSELLAIVTTTDWTNISFLRSVEAMGFKRCALASEFVIAGRHYYQLPAPMSVLTGAPSDDSAVSEAIRLRSGN